MACGQAETADTSCACSWPRASALPLVRLLPCTHDHRAMEARPVLGNNACRRRQQHARQETMGAHPEQQGAVRLVRLPPEDAQHQVGRRLVAGGLAARQQDGRRLHDTKQVSATPGGLSAEAHASPGHAKCQETPRAAHGVPPRAGPTHRPPQRGQPRTLWASSLWPSSRSCRELRRPAHCGWRGSMPSTTLTASRSRCLAMGSLEKLSNPCSRPAGSRCTPGGLLQCGPGERPDAPCMLPGRVHGAHLGRAPEALPQLCCTRAGAGQARSCVVQRRAHSLLARLAAGGSALLHCVPATCASSATA